MLFAFLDSSFSLSNMGRTFDEAMDHSISKLD